MDIEDKIKEESQNLEIHTQSYQILSKFEERKRKKKFPVWIPLTSFGILASSLPVTLICLNLPKKDTRDDQVIVNPIVEEVVSLEDSSVLSQTGLQLFYSSQLQNEKDVSVKRLHIDTDVIINVENKEERIKEKYPPLFNMANQFFETNDKMSYTYGKTSFVHDKETYNYVLVQGENKVYTKKDIREKSPINSACYVIGNRIYKGNILYKNDNGEEQIVSSFINKDRQITILKDSDDYGTGLFYKIQNIDEDKAFEFYKISASIHKGDKNRCEVIHSDLKGILRTVTEETDTNSYDVYYDEIVFSPLSILKTDFSFSITEDGIWNYKF